ncbi:MAG: hypothetical protein NTY38_30935 [Acidobacteria bacterium]|nr:hypothetical protein [Acidobacteriota bacterium]
MKALLPALLATALFIPAGAQTIPQDTEFRVKLTAALSTKTNRKGDKISAIVVSPQQFAGGIMEGEVKESKSGNKINGKSVLNFSFSSLSHAGQTTRINANIKSFRNSKGQEGVDEEGRVVEKKSNTGKLAAATGAGALIGALAGGAKGAAIGAGVGAAASLILIQVAVKGPEIAFAPGSEVLLSVKERK